MVKPDRGLDLSQRNTDLVVSLYLKQILGYIKNHEFWIMVEPSNIEKWYVNEGDIGQAIPCEMSIEELETPIIHVEWYFQQELGRIFTVSLNSYS